MPTTHQLQIRDDELFERDSFYSPGSADEAMDGIAQDTVADNDAMLETIMMMGVSLPEARTRVCAMRSSRPAATLNECMEEEPLSNAPTKLDEPSTLCVSKARSSNAQTRRPGMELLSEVRSSLGN